MACGLQTSLYDLRLAAAMFEAYFQTFDEPDSGVALTARLSAVSRGAGAAQADRIRGSPRRSAAKRICPAVRRAAGLADRLYRFGRTGDRADQRGRCVRRRPLYAAGGQAGRWQGLGGRAPGRSAAGKLAGETPDARRPPRVRSVAAYLGGRRTAGCGLRQGRRGTGRGRDQPAWMRLDRAPAAAARRRSRFTAPDLPAKPRPTSSARIRQEIEDSASTRWCCRIRMRWPGPSTSAAPTSRIRRCRCPMRWCRRTAGRPCSSITASSRTASRDHLEQSADVREPDALTPKLTALARSRRFDRARQRHRRRRAEPPDRQRRRQAGARQRSGQPAEGGQERDRDRGHAQPRIGATRWRWRGFSPGSTARRPRAR